MSNKIGDTLVGLFLIVLILACITCFGVSGILFIMYDTCPIIERLMMVGVVLGMLIFGIGIANARTYDYLIVGNEFEEKFEDGNK